MDQEKNDKIEKVLAQEVQRLLLEDFETREVLAGLVLVKLLNDKYDGNTTYLDIISDLIDRELDTLNTEKGQVAVYFHTKLMDLMDSRKFASYENLVDVDISEGVTGSDETQKILDKLQTGQI